MEKNIDTDAHTYAHSTTKRLCNAEGWLNILMELCCVAFFLFPFCYLLSLMTTSVLPIYEAVLFQHTGNSSDRNWKFECVMLKKKVFHEAIFCPSNRTTVKQSYVKFHLCNVIISVLVISDKVVWTQLENRCCLQGFCVKQPHSGKRVFLYVPHESHQ